MVPWVTLATLQWWLWRHSVPLEGGQSYPYFQSNPGLRGSRTIWKIRTKHRKHSLESQTDRKTLHALRIFCLFFCCCFSLLYLFTVVHYLTVNKVVNLYNEPHTWPDRGKSLTKNSLHAKQTIQSDRASLYIQQIQNSCWWNNDNLQCCWSLTVHHTEIQIFIHHKMVSP